MLNDETLATLERDLRRLRSAFAEGALDERGLDSDVELGTFRSVQDHGVARRTVRLTGAQLQIRLKRVDAALARIHSGSFGTCCHCGLGIEPEWLEADPATPFCRTCFGEVASERQKTLR